MPQLSRGPYGQPRAFEFIAAVKAGHAGDVEELLEANRWLVDVHNNAEETGLHWCAKRNRPEIANVLIKSGACENMRDSAGRTPLYVAANTNSVEAVVALVSARVDCRQESNSGKIPIKLTTN